MIDYIFYSGLIMFCFGEELYKNVYRRGQIDAAIGKQHYHLVKGKDSTTTWEYRELNIIKKE